MKVVKYIFEIIIILSLSVSCQDKKEHSSGSIDSKSGEIKATGFVPNPQSIPEQEVTILPIGASAPDFNLPGVDGNYYS
jgi:hypothetical protein